MCLWQRGTCGQESRRGLCHTAGSCCRTRNLSGPCSGQRHLRCLEPSQAQQGPKPLPEMSCQALREMPREVWNLQLLLCFDCGISLSALEHCCGRENRLSHSCFFSAYLGQIWERKEENAVPIFSFPGIFCRLKLHQLPSRDCSMSMHSWLRGWLIPGESQNPKIGACSWDGSALCLCSSIPGGPEQRAPARSCSRWFLTCRSCVTPEQTSCLGALFSVWVIFCGFISPKRLPVPQYPVNLQVMSGSSPQTQPFPARNFFPQCS